MTLSVEQLRRQVQLQEISVEAGCDPDVSRRLAIARDILGPSQEECRVKERLAQELCDTRGCLCHDHKASAKRLLANMRAKLLEAERAAPAPPMTSPRPTPAHVRATIDLLERTIALLEEKGMAGAAPNSTSHPAVPLIMKFWADQPQDVQEAIKPYSTLTIAEELIANGRLAKLYRECTTIVDFYRVFIEHARMKLLELEFAS